MSDSFSTLWTVAHQAPLSMGFSRQEYWSGCHFLLQGTFLITDWTWVSCIGKWILYHWATQEAQPNAYISNLFTKIWGLQGEAKHQYGEKANCKDNTFFGTAGPGSLTNQCNKKKEPWLIHVNVWQKPLQYCKVISLQLIKITGKRKEKGTLSRLKESLKTTLNMEQVALDWFLVCTNQL